MARTQQKMKVILHMICFNIMQIVLKELILVSLVNKQINDKERIAAAMENPNLRELVENCIKEEE